MKYGAKDARKSSRSPMGRGQFANSMRAKFPKGVGGQKIKTIKGIHGKLYA